MKKIKLFALSLGMMFISMFAVACSCSPEQPNVIKVESLEFYYEDKVVSSDGIEIEVGSQNDLVLKYVPEDATDTKFKILDYSSDIVTVTQDEQNSCLFKVSAKSEYDNTVATLETILRVGVDGNNDVEPASCKIKIVKDITKLSTPSNLSFDGDKFEWNPVMVDKLESYTVSVNGEEYVSHDAYLNFDKVNIFDKELSVKVKANGNFRFYDSNYSDEIKVTKLSTPKNVKFANGVLTFETNKNASAHEIKINNTKKIESINIENDQTSVDLTEYLKDAGDYQITIVAKAPNDSTNIFDSNYTSSVDVKRLNTVSNIKIENGVLTWDGVSGAVYYDVCYKAKDGDSQDLTSQYVIDSVSKYNYPLSESFLSSLTAGEYEFTVVARGNGKTILDGGVGTISNIVKKQKVEISLKQQLLEKDGKQVSLNVVSWDKNSDDDTYEVIINDNAPIIYDKNYIELDNSFASGYYSFSVRVKGNGANTFSSELSNEISVKKLEAIDYNTFNYNNEQGTVSFSANDADEFEIYVNDSLVGDYNLVQDSTTSIDNKDTKVVFHLLNYINDSDTQYKVKVKCKNRNYQKDENDNTNFVGFTDSEFSQEFVVTRLNAPVVSFDGVNINISNIQNANNYNINVYSVENAESENPTLTIIGNVNNLSNSSIKFDELNIQNNGQKVELQAEKLYVLTVVLNGDSNKKIIASKESENLKFQILPKTQITVNQSQEKLNNADFYTTSKLNLSSISNNASSYDYFITNIANGNVEKLSKTTYDTNNGYKAFIEKYSSVTYNKGIKIYAVANGKKASGNNDINYITSVNSEQVTLYQLPKISISKLQDNKLIFDKISFDGYNREIKYSFSFSINDEVVYVDNGVNFATDNDGKIEYLITNAVDHIFSLTNEDNSLKYDLSQNNYEIAVNVAVSGNDYLLSNEVSNSTTFTKLKTPTLKITDLNGLISASSLSVDFVPGQLEIEKVEGALSYVIYPYLNGALYGTPIVVNGFNGDSEKIIYQDGNKDGGKYTFKIVAVGNNKDILNSEQSSKTVTKYKAPTISVKNGIIQWDSAYNKSILPIPDCVFILEIGSENIASTKFFPYDIKSLDATDTSTLNTIKNTKSTAFPDNLPSGENYTISIVAVPVNMGSADSIISDTASITNVTKLPTPATSFVRDGKFYFSDVTGANAYAVKVNDDTIYRLNVNGNTLTSENDGAFELTKNAENLYTFNFDDLYADKSGKYEISVRAITNVENVVTSSYTVAKNVEVLENSIVSIKEGVLNFTKIEKASKYIINIYSAVNNQKGQLITTFEREDINDTTYDFVQKAQNGNWVYESGNYIFEVLAKGDEINYVSKRQTSTDQNIKSVYKLASPTKLKITNGKLAWTNTEQVTKYRINATNTKQITTDFTSKDNTFELGEKFASGIYSSIDLQLLGENEYLNSNISDKMQIGGQNNSYKLSTPKFYTNDGNLFWDHSDNNNTFYYELKLGANVYNVGNGYTLVTNTDNGKLLIQCFKVVNGVLVKDADTTVELIGSNVVQLRAVGTYDSTSGGYYFSSDYSEQVTINVLNNVSNVNVKDGELSWTNPRANSQMNGNLKLIYTKNGNLQEFSVDINDITEYHFEDAGTYIVYFRNIGNTESQGKKVYVISSKTSSRYSFEKADAPSKINSELDTNDTNVAILSIPKIDGYKYKFVLDNEYVIYSGDKNLITVEIVNQNGKNKLKINGSVFENYVINEIYNIKAMYVGDTENNITNDKTYKLSSEFSINLAGTIPDAPALKVETALDNTKNEYYTGRVIWDEVKYNGGKNTVDKYVVTTYYSQDIYIIKNQENVITLTKNNDSITFDRTNLPSGFTELAPQTISDTFINATKSGTYIRYIKSLLTDSGSYSSESVCALSYNVYANGDGSQENPYQIETYTHLTNIRYNMQANVYYEMNQDIDFAMEKSIYAVIGSQNDVFNAHFNANGHSIKNVTIASTINNYVGIFGYTGVNSVIENLVVENFTSSNGYCIGAVVGYNQGIVKNCTASGQLGTNYTTLNGTCYNGGIVGNNLGTIEGCTSNVVINTYSVRGGFETYSGGIAGINNINSKIIHCINNGQVGNEENSSQYSGGIAGYNDGLIEYSKNTGDIYSISIANNFETFAGGLIGKNERNATVQNCLTSGNVFAYYNNSSAKVYAGGLIGSNAGTVTYCMVAINKIGQKLTVSGKSSSSSNVVAGSLFGQNLNFYSDSLCIYDNILVTANNINISKAVSQGYEIMNSNFADTILIDSAEKLTEIVNNYFAGWSVTNDLPDNNA